MNLEHLMWAEDGWGYLPPSEEVFSIIQRVKSIVQPKTMLEIGFYAGHSTTYFAEFMPKCDIVSCSPPHPRGLKYGPIVEQKYSNVRYIPTPSPDIYEEVNDYTFDLVFVDGNHTKENCMIDTNVAIKLGVEYILYDNCEQRQVRHAIEEFNHTLEYVKGWTYESNFKNKINTNMMGLYKKSVDKPFLF